MDRRHDPSTREAAIALLTKLGVAATDDAVWEVYDEFGACVRYGAQRNSDELLTDNSEHAIQCPRCGRALLRVHITLHPAVWASRHEFEGVCPTCAARRAGAHTRTWSLARSLRTLWWRIRGVGAHDYRRLCRRCGRTGQAHWHVRGCWRFAKES